MPPEKENVTKITLGRLLATPNALRALSDAHVPVHDLLTRHTKGDWGDLSADDKHANDLALRTGERLLSAYRLPTGQEVWVITEWDRLLTTLLLPSDY